MAAIALPRIAVLDDIERYFADAQPAALSQHVAAASVTQQQQQQRMALARDALAQLKSAVVGQLRSHCGAAGA
jgi:RNase adaptor protein for sRNA GlmZ degradation